MDNWKCYKSQVLHFHQDSDKNVSVVFGNNGFGKTSILEAIRWCLYGADAVSNRDVATSFNRSAIRERPSLELSVQLTFELDEKNLRIFRSASRVVRGNSITANVGEAEFYEDGVRQSNPRGRIESILPAACKEFYFFDGVEIKRYAQRVHSAEMREAIERILGIPELRNLRDDAKRALATKDQELANVRQAEPALVEISERLEEKVDLQLVVSSQIDLAVSEHDASQTILEGLLAEANAQETLRTQLEQIERKKRDRDRLSQAYGEAEASIAESLRQAPIVLLSRFVTDVATDLQRRAMTSARRSGVSSQLKHILETGTCICGRPLDDGATEHIHAQIIQPASSDALTAAIREESERSQLEMLALYKPQRYADLLGRRDRVANDLDSVEEELRALSQDVDLPSISLNELWRKVGDAEANVKARRDIIASLRRDQEALEGDISKLRRERENLASKSAETAALALQVSLARRLVDASEELIEWRINETRESIEEKTSEIHRAVTNKPEEYRGVEISPSDYSLRLRSVSGESIDPDTLSAGEKEALAFSFIAGLNIASGKSAPFVMDTPFGHLDINHQTNLINALPGLPSQVTLLATDRDLPSPLLSSLRPNIADIMTIERGRASDDVSIIGSH